MTANQYNSESYFGRSSAWHGLGTVGMKTAPDAYETFGVADEVSVPLKTEDGLPAPWSAVARIKGDQLEWVSEPIAETWKWISHRQAAQIAHDGTGGNMVETMGLLNPGKGDVMFCTFPLRESKIAGDDTSMFVFYMNSLRKGLASVLGVTAVRIVCQNTLDLGIAQAHQIFRTSHRAGVVQDTTAWFSEVWNGANETADKIEDQAARMVTIPVTEKDLRHALQVILPFPKAGKPTGMTSRDQKNEAYREWTAARTAKGHAEIVDLFMGKGTGLDQPGMTGTAWGAFNAVVEWVDHYQPAESDTSRFESALVGGGRRIKVKAAKVLAPGIK